MPPGGPGPGRAGFSPETVLGGGATGIPRPAEAGGHKILFAPMSEDEIAATIAWQVEVLTALANRYLERP